MDAILPLDFSRGALTDEGLYILQIRNMWQGAGLEWFTSDALLKTPLYNLILFPFIGLNSLWSIRLILVLLSGFAWSKLLTKVNTIGLIIFALCLCQSTIFLHHHFAMAEVMVTSFITLAIYYIFYGKANHYLGLGLLFACAAVKIQYIYLLALTPVFIYYIYLVKGRIQLKKLVLSTLPLIFLVILGFYFSDNYLFILKSQSVGKFQEFGNWWFRIKVNFTPMFQDLGSLIVLTIFMLSTILVLLNWKKLQRVQKWRWLALYFMVILESHKLLLIYLPQRYLFLWWCILSTISILSISQFAPFRKIYLSTLIIPIYFIAVNFSNGTFQILQFQSKIQKAAPKKCLIGPWSGSLAIGSNKIAYPAWRSYFENRDKWEGKDVHIIREYNDNDNEGLFENIEFKDTIINEKIHDWRILIH